MDMCSHHRKCRKGAHTTAFANQLQKLSGKHRPTPAQELGRIASPRSTATLVDQTSGDLITLASGNGPSGTCTREPTDLEASMDKASRTNAVRRRAGAHKMQSAIAAALRQPRE
eukprot:189838-Chlamydomonas_euryale.AAC.13